MMPQTLLANAVQICADAERCHEEVQDEERLPALGCRSDAGDEGQL